MKKVLALAMIAGAICAGSAYADDYSRIPANIRAQIKQKCVAQHPDDFTMQDGCIMNQSDSYLRVHGSDVENLDVRGIPSAVDQAAINNAAYLTVVGKFCKTDTATMVSAYKANALKDGRLSAKQRDGMIAEGIKTSTRDAKKNTKAFCAQFASNRENFEYDLKNN